MARNVLNENEYHALKQLFLTFNIQKEDVVNSDIENIKKKFSKQYRELSLKYHPDKNPDNKEAEEQFKGDDQFIEVDNEKPSSTMSNQSYFPIGLSSKLAILHSEVSS